MQSHLAFPLSLARLRFALLLRHRRTTSTPRLFLQVKVPHPTEQDPDIFSLVWFLQSCVPRPLIRSPEARQPAFSLTSPVMPVPGQTLGKSRNVNKTRSSRLVVNKPDPISPRFEREKGESEKEKSCKPALLGPNMPEAIFGASSCWALSPVCPESPQP